MATTIQIKRSATGTSAPSLAYGELAYSFEGDTNKLWIGPSSGAAVVVGGKYYTDLFPATLGTNSVGKLLSSDATDGHVAMDGKNFTGVGSITSTTGVFGGSTKNLTISETSSTVTLDAAASTNIVIDAHNGGTNDGTLGLRGALSLAGDASDTVKNPTNNTLGTSQTHLLTENAIKNYVDTKAGAVTTISQLNSSVVVADTGTGSISNTVDANETLNISAAAATFKADNLDVSLKSLDDTTNDGSSATDLTYRETGGVALARITGSHDQGANDKRGKLILQTQPLTGTPADTTLQNVMTLDSNKKVTIHGDLQVDGTQTQLNTTTYTVDDPTLVLGGDFGTITGFSSSHSGTNWTNNSETIVTATGGKGTNAKFKVVVSGSTHTVTLEEGGIGFENSDSLTLAGIGGGDDITVTVTGVTTSPATDDDKERGIAFHYHDGTAARMGFFGIIGNDTDKNKFTFIPNATQSNNSFSGTKGTIIASTFEGALTGDVTGNVSGTAATVTSATQASITTAANLTTVGALTTGSIAATSNFAIDTLAGNITTGGKLIIDVNGGTGAAGSLSFGATGGAADAEMYFDGDDFNITTGGDLKLTADSLNVTPDASATVGQAITLFHDANNSDPKMQIGTGTAELIEITTNIGASDKLLDSARINTKTASTTANDGKLLFAVDDKDIFHIGDNGLYGKEVTDGYSWDPGTGSSEDYNFPQLDGFIINGGMYS